MAFITHGYSLAIDIKFGEQDFHVRISDVTLVRLNLQITLETANQASSVFSCACGIVEEVGLLQSILIIIGLAYELGRVVSFFYLYPGNAIVGTQPHIVEFVFHDGTYIIVGETVSSL